MDNFLIFLAHGERPLLEFHDMYDDPDYHEDENKYFTIDKNDTNFYLTFGDIGQPLYQLPINIIHYGLSSLRSREILTEKLQEISKMPSGTGLKYNSLQILLKGILFNGCIKNLFLLGEKEKNKEAPSNQLNLSPSLDWNTILKTNFLDSHTKEIKTYFNKISNFYKIDDFLDNAQNNYIDYDDPIFKMLMFNIRVSNEEAIFLLRIYDIIIFRICSMMQVLVQVSSRKVDDTLFFSLLKYYPSDEIFINYILDSNYIKIFDFIQTKFIIPHNLSFKLYYKQKPIPNYNYFINGYFGDDSNIIVKVGLRKFTDFYSLISNYIYNPTTDSNEQYRKQIEPLKTRCFESEYFEEDTTGRIIRDFSSIIDDNDANEYLTNNYKFMIDGSIYPKDITNIDFITTKFKAETGEKKLKFIKGNVRSLKKLINEEKIFGENNIILLFSCAIDFESYDKEHPTIPRARSKSIEWQDEKKYLKYKNKYLQLKKKLSLL